MLTVRKIKEITDAQMINGEEAIELEIERFSISKKNHSEGDFYIPVFVKEDRHQYIMDAVRQGAIGFMISKSYEEYQEVIKESIEINSNIVIMQVDNINEAIYKMATYVRQENVTIPIVAVTGSVGKTSTCNMIASVLKEQRKTFYDTGNNNTKPLLSWLMLNMEEDEIAVLEVGIGSKGAMEPIAKLLQPSIAVISNIGTAHIGNLGSQENILKEKLQITKYMRESKIVVLNEDDLMLKQLKLDESFKVVRYCLGEASNIKQEEGKIEFETKVYGENTQFLINAYGMHNVSNAICAIRIAELLKIDKSNIIKGIREYRNVDKRFNVIKVRNCTIIDDTYNASLASMRAGLIAANSMKSQRKIAVLGEMLELAEFSKKLHCEVGEVFKEIEFDALFTQGEDTKYICEVAKKYMKNKKVMNFQNQEELVEELLKERKRGDLIYLKASRKMQFDKIVEKLI